MTFTVSPEPEAFLCEDLSEAKCGPMGEVGVKGPGAVEDLEGSGDLTGKGMDDDLGVALLSRPCGGGVADGAGDEDEDGGGGCGMFRES
jgi:hypothetical protein